MIKTSRSHDLISIVQPANDQNIHGTQMNSMKRLLPKSTVMGLRWIWGIMGNEVMNQKKCHSMLTGADSCRFNQFAFLKCDRCVNIGEPAAVTRNSMNEKCFDKHRTFSTAAGSLCFATDLHKTNT